MTRIAQPAGHRETSGNPASEIFEQSWLTYRKVVDNNYLFHNEAYGRLRQFIKGTCLRPFRFLDIACGDAGATAQALAETAVAHYHGIDLSADALTIAAANLEHLGCRIELRRGDFAELVARWEQPIDVAWIGLSLHHLSLVEKLSVLRHIRRLVGKGGHLLIYENTSPDGEDREGWLQRWDRQRPHWTAFADDEWQAITAHVHDHDYPQTVTEWRTLGRESGFARVEEVFVSPTDLLRMFHFSS